MLKDSRPSGVSEKLIDEALDLCQKKFELQILNSRELSEFEQHINRWCEASPQHHTAWHHAQDIWFATRLAAQRRVKRDWYFRYELWLERVYDRLSQLTAFDYLNPRFAGAALSFILLVGVILFWPISQSTSTPTLPAQEVLAKQHVYETSRREQNQFTLDDGSKVVLNWDSRIKVTMKNNLRQVILEKGEAHFDVVSDKSRPFSVQTGSIQAVAVGTEYMVRNVRGASPEIVVNEGKVKVSVGEGESVLLEKDQRVVVTDKNIGPVGQINSEAALAWRQGMLVFENTPLTELLSELGRYTSFSIETGVLVDEHMPVTANYFIDRADKGFYLLAEAYDLRIEKVGLRTIRVSSPAPVRPNY